MDDVTTPAAQPNPPEQPTPPEPEWPTEPESAQPAEPRQAEELTQWGARVGGATQPIAPMTPTPWDDAPATPDSLSDAPTLVTSAPYPMAPAGPSAGFARRLRDLRQAAGQRPRRPRMGRRAALISLALLIVLGLPALLGAVSAIHDYTTLKSLGQSGITSLLAVKGDLTGKPSASLSGGSSSASLSSLTGGSGTTASLVKAIQMLLAAPGPDVASPAYTYLAQRQSGTFYPLTVTVQPAKGVPSEGDKPVTFTTTLATNTYFALGGQPIPTPTASVTGSATGSATTPAATTAPSPTATSTAGTSASGKTSSAIPDPAHIAKAEQDLRAAQSDFQQMSAQLEHPDVTLALVGMLPVAGSDMRAAQTLAQVGVDVSQAGLALLEAATPLLTRLHGASSLLSGNDKLITSADITALQQGMTVAAARLTDATQRLKTVDVSALPLSAHQKALFAEVEPLLPQITALLPQASGLIGVAGWLLGVDQARHFLVQTLDRGEMRATGGFTGQYGVLTLNDGKLAPFSLQDVNCLDYLTGCLSNGWIFGRRPPAPYNSWWPFGNWGLRDSNLSADFPTNAQLVMNVYYHESGQKVDGLIDVSPIAIEDVLRVTGPIQIPLYGETITADNLEAKLHYYQQDPAAIAKEKKLSAGDNSTSSRKRFTQLVGQLLQERVKSLPVSEMVPLAERMLLDMRSKDLEVYLTNPDAEKLLTQLHVDGSVNTAPETDGFLLVQSNVSVSKATSFVKVTQQDNVTLDNQGGATHHLTVTFSANYTYNQVYGYLTYRDYLRFYVPPQSKLLGGDGFDTGKPLCWGPYASSPGSSSSPPSATPTPTTTPGPTATPGPTPTPTPPPTPTTPALFGDVSACSANPYPHGELVCPAGHYQPGPQAPNEFGSNGYLPWANDKLGVPPNTTSDLANRAMYAGYVVVPDSCTAKVTLSWYTPNVAPKG